MRTIAFIPVWLSLAAGALAMPPPTLSYFDSFGQYSFGYSDEAATRSEYKLADGITRGTYSFIDKNGMIHTTEYEAGKDLGFRVKSSSLPQAPMPVQETLEVMKAREKHLQLLEEAQKRDKDEGERLQAAERLQVPDELRIDQRFLGEEEKKETISGTGPAVASPIAPATAPASVPSVAAVIGQSVVPGSIVTSPIHSELPHGGAQGIAGSEGQPGAPSGAQFGASSVAPMEIPLKTPVEAPQNDLPIVEDRSHSLPAEFLRSIPLPKVPDVPSGLHTLSASGVGPRSSAEPMAPGLSLIPGAPMGIQGNPSAPGMTSRLSVEPMVPGIRSEPAVAPATPSEHPGLMLPQPVKDTPEVMAAKEAHFRAYEAAARLAAESDQNPQVLEQVLRRTQPVTGLQMASILEHLNGKAATQSGLLNPQQLNREAAIKSASMSDQLNIKGAIESTPILEQLNGNSVVNSKTLLPGSGRIEDQKFMLGAIEKAAAAAAQISSAIASQRIALMSASQASPAVSQENFAQRTSMDGARQASPAVAQNTVAQRFGEDVAAPQTSDMTAKETSLVASESRAINTIVENSQIHGVTKSTEPSKLGSDETTLTCDTALKVTDLQLPQALLDKRLIITKTGEFYYSPSLNTHVPKNWGIQYVYV